MEAKGKIVSCDVPGCDQWVFLKTTGEGETDGGFTRWNEFEPYPDGWGWHDGRRLCPKHFEKLNAMLDSFYGVKG